MGEDKLEQVMEQISLVLDSLPEDLSPMDVCGALTMLATGIAISAHVPKKELEVKLFETLNYMYEQEHVTFTIDEQPLH